MPLITIRTGLHTADGQEEALTQYFCDWPDCPNIAVHSLGVITELRVMAVVCEEHASQVRRHTQDHPTPRRTQD